MNCSLSPGGILLVGMATAPKGITTDMADFPTESESGDLIDDRGYLLHGIPVHPPLEEFQRLYAKKQRSFEGKIDESATAKYERARRIGESLILRHLSGGDTC